MVLIGPMRRTLQSYSFRIPQQLNDGPMKILESTVPSIVFLTPSIRGSIRGQPPRVRWYASVVGRPSAYIQSKQQSSGSFDRAFRLGQRSRRSSKDSGQWLHLLEPYLPTVLRSPTASPFLKIGPRLAFAVPHLLRQAREESDIDLLNYLGVDQGRWKAVQWLVASLVNPVTARTDVFNATLLPSQTHWESNVPLDDATQSPVWADHEVKSKRLKHAQSPSLHDFTGRPVRPSAQDLALRQIWQSLGFMILQAADFPEDKSRTVMSNVYQIIAYLHHVGTVPNTIYNYPSAIDPSVPQRPPTLYLLSARILTTLSDAVWRAQEEAVSTEAAAVGAKFPYKGYGSPSVRPTPRVRDLGPAVWLEFVLWSCIESGYVSEGAWLLHEMGRRGGHDCWSTIHWSVLQKPRPDRAGNDGWFSSMFFTNGVIGTNEGYSDQDPLVEMGPRTISTEVVVALIDGLLSTVRAGIGSTGNTAGQIQDRIYRLKAILERDKFWLPARVWNSVIVRLLESQKMDPERDPESLERILAMAPTSQRDSESAGPLEDLDSVPSVAVTENVLNQSNAMLGLLHRTLHAFALQGNIRGARRVYARIQSFIIKWRMDASPALIAHLRRPLHEGEESIYFDSAVSDISEYFPEVPEPVLATFIDLITDSKAFEFGRWLLYSDQTGGSVVRFFSSVTVAPALLRFAAATSDSDLLNKVTSALVVPLPEGIIRTMFQCHVALSDWDGAEKILLYLKDEKNMGWGATEAAALARAVLLLDKATSPGSQFIVPALETKSFDKAKVIFRRLLQGQYNRTQLAYERRENSQVQLLSQLIRIFRTVPGALSQLCQDLPASVIQPSKSVDIPVNAFNILLDAVVSTKGSLEGRRMWHMWCKDSELLNRNPKSGRKNARTRWTSLAATAVSVNGDHPEQSELNRVVQPSLTTLRTILQAAVAERKVSTEVAARYFGNSIEESVPKQLPTYKVYRPIEVLEWGSTVLRGFGLRETSIDAELGGYLYRQKRPFVREARILARSGQRLNKKIRSSDRYSRFLARKNQPSTTNSSEANHSRPEP